MINPFDNEAASFFVLINAEGQHSMWPAFAPRPDGWDVVFGEDSRSACLDYVQSHWLDITPHSVRKLLDH